MKLSVIIPVYNEEQTITEVIDRVWAVDLGDIEKEVIIADDGSTDATAGIVDAHRYIREGLVRILHNPINLEGIHLAMKLLPDVPHVAVFDTAFHHSLPTYAYLYGLPYDWYKKEGFRRYGFHGTSHRFVSLKSAEIMRRPLGELEIISCHLGAGASLCAIDHGRSVVRPRDML